MSITSKELAAKNDRLRIRGIGGRTVISGYLSEADDLDEIMKAMRSFDNFNSDNDPYGEHDCGLFEVNGERYIFKIEYFDLNLEYGVDPKEEPAIHVLSLMYASDY